MKIHATLLVIGDPADVLGEIGAGLDERDEIRLIAAADAFEGAAALHRSSPDLVVGSCVETAGGFLDFCKGVKDAPGPGGIRLVGVIDPADRDAKGAAIREGVREFMIRPVAREELFGRLGAILEEKRRELRAQTIRIEIDSLRRTDRKRLEGLVAALVSLIDMRLPGAARRGGRAADISGRLAVRFEVPLPMRRGLEVAARLREIGRLSAPETCTGWRYVLASKAFLKDLDGFDEAAEIVGGMLENWDGSGFPGHRISGQIPLRSRILRATADLVDTIDQDAEPGWGKILEGMTDRSGTLYDPMVIAHLKTLLEEAPDLGVPDQEIRIQICGLAEGMVLAEDLVTDSGVKLLSRGTTVTGPALKAILNRHGSDPVLRGAVIRRKAAA